MCSKGTLAGNAEMDPSKPVEEYLGSNGDRRMENRPMIGIHSMTTNWEEFHTMGLLLLERGTFLKKKKKRPTII